MEPLLRSLFGVSIVCALYLIYHRWTRISLADIPGPEPESFLLGRYLTGGGNLSVLNGYLIEQEISANSPRARPARHVARSLLHRVV
jgi:hypothetical protein